MPIAHLSAAVDPETKVPVATLPRWLKQPRNGAKHPGEFRFHVRAGEQGVTVHHHDGTPVKDATGDDISQVGPGVLAVFTPAVVSTPHPQGEPMKHPETGKVLARPGESVVTAWQRLDDVRPN